MTRRLWCAVLAVAVYAASAPVAAESCNRYLPRAAADRLLERTLQRADRLFWPECRHEPDLDRRHACLARFDGVALHSASGRLLARVHHVASTLETSLAYRDAVRVATGWLLPLFGAAEVESMLFLRETDHVGGSDGRRRPATAAVRAWYVLPAGADGSRPAVPATAASGDVRAWRDLHGQHVETVADGPYLADLRAGLFALCWLDAMLAQAERVERSAGRLTLSGAAP